MNILFLYELISCPTSLEKLPEFLLSNVNESFIFLISNCKKVLIICEFRISNELIMNTKIMYGI